MIGSRLGRYRIVERLGAGAMGTVYLAEDGDRSVALKLFHPHLMERVGFLERFRREAKAGILVRHPNVVRTHDLGVETRDGVPHHYLVMEHVRGTTLRDLLEEEGRQNEAFLREVGRQVAEGLAAIHEQGIVHRDLKPENVLITTAEEIKVMDLGIALLRREALRLSMPGDFVGSVLYAAPEQIRSAGGELDERVDLFSFGLVLYELATGDLPHADGDAASVFAFRVGGEPGRLGDVRDQVSPFFEEVVHTLLARDPDERFASARALAEVLRHGESSEWWLKRSGRKTVEPDRIAARIRVARTTSVRGRERELSVLHRHFDRTVEGEGQVILLEGEAGVGKTRLLDEFVTSLEDDGVDLSLLYGAYPPGGAATATGAFCTAYREYFGTERLEESLARHLPDTPGLRPGLAAILRGEPTPPGTVPLDREASQTAFVRITRSLARVRPLVVIIDDLHLAPEDGRGMFAALAWAVPGLRVLLVGTSRPGLPETWVAGLARLEQTTHLTVPRLRPAPVLEIVGERFRSDDLAETLGPRIATWSDGNPFFVFEILRGLVESEVVTKSMAGPWEMTGDPDGFTMPISVQDMIHARIVALDDDERALLDVASCAGYEFEPVLVGTAMGLQAVAVLRRLGHLERGHRLVHPTGERFLFDHHLIRETLYESLPEGLRGSYHHALGDALETRLGGPDRDPHDLEGDLPVTLCDHFFRARLSDRAERYTSAAMDHLEQGGLVVSALDLAEKALATEAYESPESRAPLLLRVVDLLEVTGRREDQRRTLEEALRLSDAMVDQALMARSRRLLSIYHGKAARYEMAEELARQAMDLARNGGDRVEEASALIQLGNLAADVTRFSDAREHYERSLSLADSEGDARGVAKALGSLGFLSFEEGRAEEALALAERCLDALGEIGATLDRVKAIGLRGVAWLSLGRLDEADEEFESQKRLARDIGYRRGEAYATGNRGQISALRGRFEEALRHYRRERQINRSFGDVSPGARALSSSRVADILARTGRSAEAWDAAQEAVTISREIGGQAIEAFALESQGLAAEQLGRPEEAVELLREAVAIREGGGDRRDDAHAKMLLGAVLARLDRRDDAGVLFRKALAIGQETRRDAIVIRAGGHLARLGLTSGAGAREAYRERGAALPAYERMEAAFVLHSTEEDADLLHEAHRILMKLRDDAPGEDREAILSRVPLHREILAAMSARG